MRRTPGGRGDRLGASPRSLAAARRAGTASIRSSSVLLTRPAAPDSNTMRAGGTVRDTGQQVRDLIGRAEAAVAGSRWLEALDLASQALAVDPLQREAAVLVGTARQRLGAIGAASAELRQVSVLAIDMERSTAIAARLGPEKMRELMMAVYESCAEAVARYEGRVTKYSGDGVLAQFGHPIAHEDDARRAVLAAMAVLERVERSGPQWEAQFGASVQVRAGIDSGVAAVGPVDASPWSPEELAGDPPNVATRVQSTAAPMTIRVTDATHRLIEGWFETERVGAVALRNYPHPIGLHVVLRQTEADTRLEARIRARPSLVGRDEELATMRAAWNRVVGGERQVVSITGEAGIGKSRLVEHMIATAAATGASHVTLACSQLHRDSPLRPVARALRRFFRVFPNEGGGDALWLEAIRTRLEQLPNLDGGALSLVPVYGWLLGIRSAVDLEPEQLRRQAFEAVIELLEAMARSSVLVLAIEDADAADPSTVELITALLSRPALPMLVTLTSRAPVPWAQDADHALELATLPAGHAEELVRSIAPDLRDDAVTRLVKRSDGVPFFAEELALAAGEAPLTGALADTFELSGFLAARIDELGPDLKQLVGHIAVAGQEIRLDVLERFAQLTRLTLDRLVSELLDRRVVVRGVGPTGEVLRFRHGLMRSVAYGSLLASRRAELHGRLAAVLGELAVGAAAPEDLANHYELAGDRAAAAPRWLEAGQLAAAAGANTEAIELFGRCLSALSALAPGPERSRMELDAQLGHGTTLSAVAGYTSPQARASFERAVTLAEGLENTIAIMPALWGAWAYWLGARRAHSGLCPGPALRRDCGGGASPGGPPSAGHRDQRLPAALPGGLPPSAVGARADPAPWRRRPAGGLPPRSGDRGRRLVRGGVVVRRRRRGEPHPRDRRAGADAGTRSGRAPNRAHAGIRREPARVAGRARRRSPRLDPARRDRCRDRDRARLSDLGRGRDDAQEHRAVQPGALRRRAANPRRGARRLADRGPGRKRAPTSSGADDAVLRRTAGRGAAADRPGRAGGG